MATEQDVTNYLNNHYGIGVDVDGKFGYQCVDLIADYSKWLGHPMSAPLAKTLWTEGVDPWYEKVPNSPENSPQLGDIVVFGGAPSNGNDGHCSVAKIGNAVNFISLDQNWVNFNAAHGSVAAWVTHDYDNVLGWYRPQLSANPPPTTSGLLTVTSPMNVRTAPNLSGVIVEVLQPGTVVNYTGTVAGENVAGNSTWYHSAQGHYYWSGNVK